ncbi:MAG: hypothetical protein GWP07_04965 [Xanthomonadaceae bacterium]|nr:hypothetical protein [Xanthomonadaceae bacterium]
MRLKTVDSLTAQKILFNWLQSSADHAVAGEPLFLTPEDLRQLCRHPLPPLEEAWRWALMGLLVQFESHPGGRGIIQLPAAVALVTIAAYNCQAQSLGDRQAEVISSWNDAVMAMIPPARDRDAMLAYHAVLAHVPAGGRTPADWQKKLKADLVERSPLTGLLCLDEHTPQMLAELAAEMLPGWQVLNQIPSPWKDREEWLETVILLLQDRTLGRWLRKSWLDMPETRGSCRNLGLLFEALRRRGGLEDILLEFYEAYDYFGRLATADGAKATHHWPVLVLTAGLLKASSQTTGFEAARLLNRHGHEYLLKFRPLIEIIIARQEIPAEYRALSRELVHEYLRPLLDYVAEGGEQRLNFGRIRYAENAG